MASKSARKKQNPKTEPKPPAGSERFAGIFMSLLSAIGFGAMGLMALWNRSVTLPGRNGPVQNSGSAAEILGWVLLAAATAFLANFAILLRPGKAGAKWALAILLWGVAAASYYVVNHVLASAG